MTDTTIEKPIEEIKPRQYYSRVSLWFSVTYLTLFNLLGIIIGFVVLSILLLNNIIVDLDSNSPLTLYFNLTINAIAICIIGIFTFIVNKSTPHIKSQKREQKLNKNDWKLFAIAFTAIMGFVGSYQLFISYLQNNLLPEGVFENPYEFFSSDKLGILIFATFVVSVLAPISEELFYRWTLIGSLRQGFSKSATILFSALIFSLAHSLTNLIYSFSYFVVHLIATFIVGLILGFVYYMTRKVILTIILHGLWNFTISSSAFFDKFGLIHIFTYIFIAIVCISILFLVGLLIYYIVKKKQKIKEIVDHSVKTNEKKKIRMQVSWFELILVYFLLAGIIPSILGLVSFGTFFVEGLLQMFYFVIIVTISLMVLQNLLSKPKIKVERNELFEIK